MTIPQPDPLFLLEVLRLNDARDRVQARVELGELEPWLADHGVEYPVLHAWAEAAAASATRSGVSFYAMILGGFLVAVELLDAHTVEVPE